MSSPPPRIPDYTLLRCVGRGAYGEVWLARGVTGLHRAVKLVFRAGFSEDRPYEREFSGIKRFQAVSHSQENLVNILHVGRNDEAGYFFYVMELADAADSVVHGRAEPGEVELARLPGSDLNVAGYEAGTLKQLLRASGRLPVARCVDIAKGLARAIHHLHRHGLIHRDIKPSNVIFVNGTPKLADIGLVAGLDESRSFVGTEGFVPPEGPGTVGSDLFAFGRLLYELSSGRDRMDYPRLPENFDQLPDRAALVEFNEIVLRAGDPERERRYASADEVVRDLLLLEAGKSVRRLRLLETRFSLALRAAAVAVAVTLVAVAAWLWATFQAREARRNFAESERNRLAAEAALREVLLNQVRANRQSGWTGQRLESLRLLRENPTITNNLAFRSEAIACLALPDARPLRSIPLPRMPNTGARWAMDRQLTRYATNDRSGAIWVRSAEDDRVLSLLPSPGAAVVRYGFAPDDASLGASYADRTFVVWPLANFPATRDGRPPAWSDLPESVRPGRALLPPGVIAGAGVPGTGELAALDRGGRLHFLNPTNGAISRAITVEALEGALRFNADGLKLAMWRSNECVIYRATDGTRLFTLKHPARVTQAAWHPNGRHLATTCFDFKVRIWDTRDGQQLSGFGDHEAEVVGVEFDETGTLLATSSWDSSTRFWSPGSARALVRMRGSGNSLRLAGNGTRMAYSSWAHDQLVLTEILPGRERVAFERIAFDRGGGTYGLTFSPDAQFIVAGDPDRAQIWQWPFFEPVATLPVGDCATPRFSPDGHALVTAGNSEVIEWSFAADPASASLRIDGAREIVEVPGRVQAGWYPSRDGRAGAVATDRNLRLFQREGGAWNLTRTIPGKFRGVSFSADGKLISVERDSRRLEIMDLQGQTVTNLECINAPISQFTPDGRWLILARGARYQAVETGTWREGPSVARNPAILRGRLCIGLAAGAPLAVFRTDDTELSLVDLNRWETLARIPIPLATTAVELSADGSRLAVATEKIGIEVWDVARVRAGLRTMGLDWPSSEPKVGPDATAAGFAPRLRPVVEVDPPRRTNDSPLVFESLPPRSPNAPADCLDLSRFYNGSLAAGWIPPFQLGATGEHTLPIPPGVQRLGDADFDIRGVIQLASSTLAARGGTFPEQVSGIPVGRRCRRVHFLHGTDGRGKAGALIGAYAIRYVTGEEEVLWLTYGRDVLDWWTEPPAAAGSRGGAPMVAWTGTNAASGRQNASVRVYRTTWENPRWDLVVQSIDVASLRTATGPFVLAITVEP